jgi:hypothetical protein
VSDILDQISHITGKGSSITSNVSNTIESIANIGLKIESIISSVSAATTIAGVYKAKSLPTQTSNEKPPPICDAGNVQNVLW